MTRKVYFSELENLHYIRRNIWNAAIGGWVVINEISEEFVVIEGDPRVINTLSNPDPSWIKMNGKW